MPGAAVDHVPAAARTPRGTSRLGGRRPPAARSTALTRSPRRSRVRPGAVDHLATRRTAPPGAARPPPAGGRRRGRPALPSDRAPAPARRRPGGRGRPRPARGHRGRGAAHYVGCAASGCSARCCCWPARWGCWCGGSARRSRSRWRSPRRRLLRARPARRPGVRGVRRRAGAARCSAGAPRRSRPWRCSRRPCWSARRSATPCGSVPHCRASRGRPRWSCSPTGCGPAARSRPPPQARAQEQQRLAAEERLRVARELHDVLAHSISLINVQAGVALHLLDEQPGAGPRGADRRSGRRARDGLRDLRRTLGVLREEAHRCADAGPGRPRPAGGRARAAGAGGRPLEVRGTPRPVRRPGRAGGVPGRAGGADQRPPARRQPRAPGWSWRRATRLDVQRRRRRALARGGRQRPRAAGHGGAGRRARRHAARRRPVPTAASRVHARLPA